MTVKGNVHIRGNVNNIHFNELTSKLVTRDAAQAINGPLTFVDHVVADSLIVAGPVNGLNLTDLLRDAVTKSTKQVGWTFLRSSFLRRVLQESLLVQFMHEKFH